MPSFNFTIPDSSPLIIYDGSWLDTPKTDADWEQYQNDTYHITSQAGATATLNFNGSAIYIYGAKKPNYDNFDVIFDGGSPATVSATASGKEFNTLLYSATSLDTTKPHTLVVRNDDSSSTQGSSMDIDYMIITAGDGNSQTTSQDAYWNQDIGSDKISYSADWYTGSNVNYSDGTASITYAPNAAASVTFEGSAIALYGTVNSDHAMFSVSIDGGAQSDFSGYAPEPRFQMLLFYANGLTQGHHVLQLTDITADPTGARQNGLEFDGALIQSWPDSSQNTTVTGTNSPTQSVSDLPSADNTPTSRHLHVGAIVGVVVAVAAVFLVLVLTVCMLRRRSRSANGRKNLRPTARRYTPDPFLTPRVGSLDSQIDVSGRYDGGAVPIGSLNAYSSRVLAAAAPAEGQTASLSEKELLPHVQTGVSPTAVDRASRMASDMSYSDLNPHHDFPPPDYQQVFPPSVPVYYESPV